MEPSSAVPQNWHELLRIDDNKMELFSFLATNAAAMDTNKQVISTHHSGVLCTQPRDVSGLAPCNHEEANTRLILQVEDAVKQGHTKVSIRTVDTTVIILAVTSAQRLDIPELSPHPAESRRSSFAKTDDDESAPSYENQVTEEYVNVPDDSSDRIDSNSGDYVNLNEEDISSISHVLHDDYHNDSEDDGPDYVNAPERAHRYHPCADSGGAKMNTCCPLKRVPSAARFFTHCELTLQPPQSYSIGGQRSSGQLTGKPAGARPDYRGNWCAKHCSLKPCSCVYFSDNKLKLGAADSNPAVFWDTGEGRSPQHKQTKPASIHSDCVWKRRVGEVRVEKVQRS
ncbi:UNVERIFIED_CONTAM: hypothetical protein FKN15_012345 [Acipenser sinensis]